MDVGLYFIFLFIPALCIPAKGWFTMGPLLASKGSDDYVKM